MNTTPSKNGFLPWNLRADLTPDPWKWVNNLIISLVSRRKSVGYDLSTLDLNLAAEAQ